MIWLLLLLFVASYTIMRRTTERFPRAEYVYNACMCGLFVVLMISAIIAVATDTPASPRWLIAFPPIIGGMLGVISAAGAALRKKVEAQVYSFCPVCASCLAEKQNGEQKVLVCTSCRWMQDAAT